MAKLGFSDTENRQTLTLGQSARGSLLTSNPMMQSKPSKAHEGASANPDLTPPTMCEPCFSNTQQTPVQQLGVPTPPQSAERRLGRISDTGSDLVDKAMDRVMNIRDVDKYRLLELLAKGEGRFEIRNVTRKIFEKWRSDKEEIGGFEYDSSLKSIIIKADGGPLHEGTVGALYNWLRSLVSEDKGFRASLGEGTVCLLWPLQEY